MSPRSSMLTALIILVLLGSYWYFFEHNQTEETAAEQEPVKILSFDRDAVQSIEIRRRDGTTIRLEKHVPSDTKNSEDSQDPKPWWTLESPIQWEAAQSPVDALLAYASDLKAERMVDAEEVRSEGLSAFGLDQPRAEVTLHLPDGDKRLLIGDITPVGGAYYAKVPEQEKVYTILSVDARPFLKDVNDFRHRGILSFDVNEVTELQLANPQGTTYLKKEGALWYLQKPWHDLADYGAVSTTLWPFSSLTAEKFVDDSPNDLAQYGLDDPQATVRMVIGAAPEQKETKVLIGKAGEQENTFYVQIGDAPNVYLARTGSRVLEIKPFDLLRQDLVTVFDIDVDKIELVRNDTRLVLTKEKPQKSTKEKSANSAEDEKEDTADATIWHMSGAGAERTVSRDSVKSLLEAVRDIDVEELGPLATENRVDELDTLLLTLHITDTDGKKQVKTLRLKDTGDGKPLVAATGRTHIYFTSADAFQRLMEAVDSLIRAESKEPKSEEDVK